MDAHNNRGNALQALGRLEEALAAHGRAVALRPDYPEALTSLGNTHLMGGRVEEAMEIYGRALAIDPDFGLANFNLSLALLLRGDLPAGFRRYESRWETDRLRPKKKDFPQPAWDGSPPGEKPFCSTSSRGSATPSSSSATRSGSPGWAQRWSSNASPAWRRSWPPPPGSGPSARRGRPSPRSTFTPP